MADAQKKENIVLLLAYANRTEISTCTNFLNSKLLGYRFHSGYESKIQIMMFIAVLLVVIPKET